MKSTRICSDPLNRWAQQANLGSNWILFTERAIEKPKSIAIGTGVAGYLDCRVCRASNGGG